MTIAEESLVALADRLEVVSIANSVSIIAPTRNEQANIDEFVRQVHESLEDHSAWELIVVDDSDDATLQSLERLSSTYPRLRYRHRCPQERTGGLGGAVMSGFELAVGEVLLVMDADLQHPPTAAAQIAAVACGTEVDVVIGSRYVPGGSTRGLDGVGRRLVSTTAARLTRLLFPSIRRIRDPLAGLFAVRREVIAGAAFSPSGFKILLEILIVGGWTDVIEVPVQFAPRLQGKSKASFAEGIRFLRHLLRLIRIRSVRSLRAIPSTMPFA